MQTKLYRELASRILAIDNCKKSGNVEWITSHTLAIYRLLDMLPHGSGIDSEWHYIDLKSNCHNIILTNSFHAMDEYGGYDRWIDFTLQITASLISGFDLHLKGNFGKYQDIKNYLYDILNESFNQDIDTEKLI